MKHEAIPNWQTLLSSALDEPLELLRRLGLSASQFAEFPVGVKFKMRVPEPYIQKMRRGDPRDPLLLQVLPQGQEMLIAASEQSDPVDDQSAMLCQGLLQKYAGRALMITTGACAIHCRYCFRREFPYSECQSGGQHLPAIMTHLENDASINEIILSGGDPLSLSDERLFTLIQQLDSVPHLERLRIHTRLPVAIPQRITSRLLEILSGTRLLPVVVLHVNHAAEIDDDFKLAMNRLHRQGIQLLNQSVLLKGINDSTDALSELSEALFRAHILPYYLHQLDPVHGTDHFSVPDKQALELQQAMQAQLPGYLVPRLVREIPGRASKSPLTD